MNKEINKEYYYMDRERINRICTVLKYLSLIPSLERIDVFKNTISTDVAFKLLNIILSDTEWIDSVYKTIHSSRKAAEAFTEMGIKNPVTLLLYGKPGTGKTEFVRYAAHELGLPIFVLNFSQMIDSHLGETSKNINLIFNYIKNNECILFLDELDCIAGNRQTATGAEKELSRISITLMQEIDRLPNNVIVIAATNMPSNIDTALLERFSFVKEVKELTYEDNLRFVEFYLNESGAIKYFDEKKDREFINVAEIKNQRELIHKLNQIISLKIVEQEN